MTRECFLFNFLKKWPPGRDYLLAYFEEQGQAYSQCKKQLKCPKVLVEKSIDFTKILVIASSSGAQVAVIDQAGKAHWQQWVRMRGSLQQFQTVDFFCLWENCKYHKHHKNCRQDGKTNSTWHTSCMSNNFGLYIRKVITILEGIKSSHFKRFFF